MYQVRVENSCSCFKKSGLAEVANFDTKELAKKEAEYMLGVMKSNFCQKHEFSMSETLGDFTIYIKPRS